VHGDIGIIGKDDAVILISHSGHSDELLTLIPHIKRQGAKIITLTRDKKCPLARFADIPLETNVKREACPFNLVPTTSSTVTSAIGDALAIALLKIKGFERKDYKIRHPGGAIGKRLLYRVEDLMKSGKEVPVIPGGKTLQAAINEMSRENLGMTCITDNKGRLTGILTDGDLRRLLEKNRANLFDSVDTLLLSRRPKTIGKHLLAVEALSMMEKNSITSLIVVNNPDDRKVIGVVRMHDILKAGVV
jgi:arabinose-5-phosphate isomerase